MGSSMLFVPGDRRGMLSKGVCGTAKTKRLMSLSLSSKLQLWVYALLCWLCGALGGVEDAEGACGEQRRAESSERRLV